MWGRGRLWWVYRQSEEEQEEGENTTETANRSDRVSFTAPLRWTGGINQQRPAC